MAVRTFLDTNILIYSVSDRPEDAARRVVAERLVQETGRVLSMQTLNEFIWQVTRPGARVPLPTDTAFAFIRLWRRHHVQNIDAAVFKAAQQIATQTNYAWWDCLIVAAARVSDCALILSEDMQDGRVIDGVRIENPFRTQS